jgi:precorrin-4/cobalt-precorrin-4 C11-methyltransferase
MRRIMMARFIIFCLGLLITILSGHLTFADTGKFYIIGMGTVPDLLTIRGAKTIEKSQIIMLEGEQDKDVWKEYIGQKAVWMVPNSARRYFGLDPEKVKDEKLKIKVQETDKVRREIIDRIIQAVRSGKIVSALQSGDPMMFGMTYYLEMLPDDIPTEIIPGIGAFQAASAAVEMSPPYGWDTNSVILTAADWEERKDKNETLMSHQTSMAFYTMFLDYPALFKDLNRHYPGETPVAVVCNAGDLDKQKIIRSTVGRFLDEVKYKELPVHMLFVGKFLKAGQARKDALMNSSELLENHQ